MILKEIYVTCRLVDKNKEKLKRVLKRIHKKIKEIKRSNFFTPVQSKGFKGLAIGDLKSFSCLANSISI